MPVGSARWSSRTVLTTLALVLGLTLLSSPHAAVRVSSEPNPELERLRDSLGIDPELFSYEFGTVAAGLIDMVEAGILEADGLLVIERALVLDPSLEEFSTIVAAVIDMVDAGISPATALAVLDLVSGLVDRVTGLEEVTTVTAAAIDMADAGITEPTVLAGLELALGHDSSLEELTTITAALIDLVADDGLTEDDALARIHAALAADPSLDSFDDEIATDD